MNKRVEPLFSITPTQATVISFVVMVGLTAVMLISMIGYRDSKIGFLPPVAVIAGLAAIAIFMRPQLGAYILIITLFTNMSSVFSDQGLPSINKPLVAFVLLAVIINRIIYKRPFTRLSPTEMLLLAYGFVLVLSVFGATDRYLALDQVVDFAKDFVIVLLIVIALETASQWNFALWLVVLSGGILGIMSSYQSLTGNYDQIFGGFANSFQEQVLTEVYQVRVIGPLADPNFYGLIMVAAVPLAIYFFLGEKRKILRVVALIATLSMIFVIINTYSRGAFVALVLILLIIALEQKISASLLVSIGIGALLLMPLLPGNFDARIKSLVALGSSGDDTVQQESSFRGRSSEYISGFMMFVEHPLLGVGADNYPPNYQIYSSQLGLDSRTEEREAHSLYIETMAETGIAGIITLTGVLLSLLIGLPRARKTLQSSPRDTSREQRNLTAVLMSLIAFLIASIFLHGAYIRYLWLIIALGVVGINLAKKEQSVVSANTVISKPS